MSLFDSFKKIDTSSNKRRNEIRYKSSNAFEDTGKSQTEEKIIDLYNSYEWKILIGKTVLD